MAIWAFSGSSPDKGLMILSTVPGSVVLEFSFIWALVNSGSTLGAGVGHVRNRPANLARRRGSGFNHFILHIGRFIADGLARLTAWRRRQQNSKSSPDSTS